MRRAITVGGITTSGTDVARNVISGNRANGVSLGSNFAGRNTISGNYIGVGADGATAIGNRDNGVQISNLAANNTVGGTGVTVGACDNSCNLIANNSDPVNATSARAGIYIDPTGKTGNTIRGNSIFNNTGIGIDLDAVGVAANDAGDPDTGPNNIQNYPVLSSAETNGSVVGTLNSTANTMFAIDFYSNTAADGTGSEGRTFIGSTSVITDGGGNATFNYGTTATQTAGQFVTATATSTGGLAQAVGDTSEFSAAQTVAASMTAAQGLEADVINRPNGNGVVDADDIQEIRRFAIGLDMPYQSNEFQRADDSPRNNRGNGVVDADDVEQARRYSVGLDTKQSAGGPTAPPQTARAQIKYPYSLIGKAASPEAGRAVRVISQNTSPSQMITVPINVDTQGDETGYTFSISFDQTKLTATSVMIGDLGGNVLSNINNGNGTIGISVTSFPGPNGTIAPVTNQTLVRVMFTVAANAPAGATPINFTDNPASRKVSGVDPNNPLPQPTYENGTVNIAAPTAAPVIIGGRVVNQQGRGVSNAQVTMIDNQGAQRTARTNIYGYFRVANVASGETYTVTVKSKRYSFTPLVVNATQDADNVNFTAQPER